ncbi:glycosyltransferase [Clostridium perfringens]
MKKKIIFVIDSLNCAGAEKSLTTLLNLIDYSKYFVDLQLFSYGGEFEKLLPKEVNLLKPLKYTSFCDLDIKSAIVYSIKNCNYNMLLSRINFSFTLRKKKYSNKEKARIFWQKVSNVIQNNENEYDIAISYAQGIPTFYVADKIKAKNKYAWVNTSYKLNELERNFQKKYYLNYNKIITVSHSAKEIFSDVFPEFLNKIEIIYDINDYSFINKMALIEDDDLKEFKNFDGIKILTLGRLASGKRYDRAIKACKKLVEKGIYFRWYALGIGPLEEEIKRLIIEKNLEDYFILLGVKANPYPYIKNCDIYVQTSDFEGFGLAIAEARMLNKPVVVTRFDSVYNQMINEKNGLVVDMSSDGVAEGIYRLLNDNKLRSEIIKYISNEKKGNIEELDKFYKLIES